MNSSYGILSRRINETPVAMVDFETTGLTPGFDRVVEVSVVRMDPGQRPHLCFDTLVNPMRPVAATEIHGITDDDVAQAPRFNDIAGDLIGVLTDCVVAAHNVYFDIRFLQYELEQSGVNHEPPHFCLMYMRPMLGLGCRCKLEEACRAHDIEHEVTHVAAQDAEASGALLGCYLEILRERNIATFGELAQLKNYKFLKSFGNDPLPHPKAFNLAKCDRLCSRSQQVAEKIVDPSRHALGAYWDALRTVVADLEITEDEMEYMVNERRRLGLKEEQVRVLHARAFTSAITQFIDDQWLDDQEAMKLQRLHNCLAQLGWAPGQ